MFYELAVLLITLTVCVISYFKWSYKYWQKKGMPYIEPQIPFGNGQNQLRQKVATYEIFRGTYNYCRSKGLKHCGLYLMTTPVYLPVDLDLTKHIMAIDFAYFMDRGTYVNEKNDPLSGHLFSLEGQKWRNMRMKLSPTFTSGKMKMMFQTLLDCGDQLQEYIDKLNVSKEPLDLKEVLAKFTTDVIGSCAFGIDCNSFKDPNSEFRQYGRQIFTSNFWRRVRLLFILNAPDFSRKIGLCTSERSTRDFFMNMVKGVAAYRDENNVVRNDFMQLLLELRNKETNDNGKTEGLTLEQMTAQAFVFFIAGFETSSTTMNYCLFELAQNPDIQEKLRREIDAMFDKNGGKLTYDGLMELKYMGQVIDETLRKYPPAPVLLRLCVKDYKIPQTDIILEKGTRVFISVLGIHHDPEIYPDPEKFDPDRFSDEKKAKRHSYAFIPFGEGPRNCIGLRFGLMQVRVGLALILKHYRLKLNPKTQVPLKMDPNSFVFAIRGKIWMDTEKLV